MTGPTFQDIIQTLNRYWAAQGCVLIQPLDTEVGAGTFHPATFLRAHRRALVNLAHVTRLQPNEVGGFVAVTTGGHSVEVSRQVARELRKRLGLR